MAIRLSEENVQNGGGPFGAVIAKEGVVIATGGESCDGKQRPDGAR